MCRDCTGINIGEGFFQTVGEHLGRLDSRHHFFLCNKGLYPEFFLNIYYNLTGRGDLDLIDFQQHILRH